MNQVVKKPLPLEEAVQEAAEQTWAIDLTKGNVKPHEKDEEFYSYLGEARAILESTGEYYLPEPPFFEHIVVKKPS